MVQLNGIGSRRRFVSVLAAATLAAVGGCHDAKSSHFPLVPGWRFEYRLHLDTEGTGAETSKSASVNLAPMSLDGIQATPRLFQDGRILYYADDGTGIRAVAFRKPGEDATPAAPGQYILKYPLQAGTRWRAPSRTVLLTQRFLYSKALPITISIDLDYAIARLDDAVQVPAGHFTNCIKVTGTGHTTVTTSDNQRTLDVDIEVVEWYAPGIGLVKSSRTERAGEERAGNAHLVSELEYVGMPSWFD